MNAFNLFILVIKNNNNIMFKIYFGQLSDSHDL